MGYIDWLSFLTNFEKHTEKLKKFKKLYCILIALNQKINSRVIKVYKYLVCIVIFD